MAKVLNGMEFDYLTPGEDALKEAMDKYTRWLYDQSGNVDHTVDQNEKALHGWVS